MAVALRERGNRILVEVAVSPGAKSNAVRGEAEGAVRITLRAGAREGRANEALVKFLAAKLGVPKRDVEIVRGKASRRKTVAVAGSTPEKVRRRLAGEES